MEAAEAAPEEIIAAVEAADGKAAAILSRIQQNSRFSPAVFCCKSYFRGNGIYCASRGCGLRSAGRPMGTPPLPLDRINPACGETEDVGGAGDPANDHSDGDVRVKGDRRVGREYAKAREGKKEWQNAERK